MEEIHFIFNFIKDAYAFYINLFIITLKAVNIHSFLLAVILSNIPIVAFQIARLNFTSYKNAIFTKTNILISIFMGVIMTFFSNAKNDGSLLFTGFFLFIGIAQVAGEQIILSNTLKKTFKEDDY